MLFSLYISRLGQALIGLREGVDLDGAVILALFFHKWFSINLNDQETWFREDASVSNFKTFYNLLHEV